MVGGFQKKTIEDVELAGKRVFLRADYNVPVENGRVAGDFRITQSLPTLKHILSQKPAILVIASHLGRPEGKPEPQFSLKPVVASLEKYLGRTVHFFEQSVGDETKTALSRLPAGSVALLENLRFYPGEKQNDPAFAKQLIDATGAEIYINDAFGVDHRADASLVAITKLLPAYAGLLLKKEIETIGSVMSQPQRPLTVVVGGAKIEDKIDVLKKFVETADCVALTGALANNFLKVQGVKVGKSLIDKDNLELAEDIIDLAEKQAKSRPFKLIIPSDGVVSRTMDGKSPTHVVNFASGPLADIEAYPKVPPASSHSLSGDEGIFDIGPATAAEIAGAIELSRTVIWAGPCGAAEVKGIAGAAAPFAHGTKVVMDAMMGERRHDKSRPFSVVGGGDTAAYVESEGLIEDFDFVSTGGGAGLELMSGKKLPGVEALPDK